VSHGASRVNVGATRHGIELIVAELLDGIFASSASTS
jgi:hypothetical protein